MPTNTMVSAYTVTHTHNTHDLHSCSRLLACPSHFHTVKLYELTHAAVENTAHRLTFTPTVRCIFRYGACTPLV